MGGTKVDEMFQFNKIRIFFVLQSKYGNTIIDRKPKSSDSQPGCGEIVLGMAIYWIFWNSLSNL